MYIRRHANVYRYRPPSNRAGEGVYIGFQYDSITTKKTFCTIYTYVYYVQVDKCIVLFTVFVRDLDPKQSGYFRGFQRASDGNESCVHASICMRERVYFLFENMVDSEFGHCQS